MPERVACQSAPAQAARLAWARHPRLRRRSLLPSPTLADPSAGSGAMCLAKRSSREWSAAASSTASLKALSLWARGAIPCSRPCPRPRCPRLRELPILPRTGAVEGAIENGAGKSGARLRLDAALEAAEDGHVAGLQVRRALWREEAQHNVRECGLHSGQGGLAGVDAGHVPEDDCPSLPGLSTPSNVAVSCRSVVVVAQPFSDVTWWVRSGQGCSGKTASVLPACTICTSMSSGPRSMLATVNVVASLVLPCSWACLTPRRPHL